MKQSVLLFFLSYISLSNALISREYGRLSFALTWTDAGNGSSLSHCYLRCKPKKNRAGRRPRPAADGRTSVPLHASIPFSSEATTPVSLVGSSVIGVVIESYFPTTGSGIIATILSAVACSKAGLTSQSHPIHDFAWSIFLPASLVFILFGVKDRGSPRDFGTSHTLTAVKRMAIPFLMASIGSAGGALVAFWLCSIFPAVFLPPEMAAMATSCLAASFIGGSVNFFATAAAIAPDTSHGVVSTSSLLTSMAAVDLVIMMIYFSLLSIAAQSESLHRLFHGHRVPNEYAPIDQTDLVQRAEVSVETAYTSKSTELLWNKVSGAMLVSSVALLLVHVARRAELVIERVTSLPGTACGCLAVITPLLRRAFFSRPQIMNAMLLAAGPLSTFCFLMLFASIGATTNIDATLLNGPACLAISTIALLFHCLIAFFGSRGWKRFTGSRILYEDVLIASNAAIGGPATAAAFCGQLGGDNATDSVTLAATIWGIVGYAVGTTIGISMYRLLSKFLASTS